MNCKRCNKRLIEGKNIPERWHIPICKECREKTIKDTRLLNLSKEEEKIMRDRLKRDLNR